VKDIRDDTPKRKLVSRVQNLFVTMNAPLDNWAAFLLHPDLDNEPHLRNRIFCILAISMAEAASEAENRIIILDREAQRLGLKSVRKHLIFAKAYCDGIAHILSGFSDAEMFAMHRWRNMYTHGRIDNVFQERYTVYYAIDGNIRTKKVDRKTYLSDTLDTIESFNGTEPFLTTMRARFTHRGSFFWHLSLSMRTKSFVPSILRELEEDRTDIILVTLADDDFMATHQLLLSRGDELYSFKTIREKMLEEDDSSIPDPVFFDPNAITA